MVDSRSYAWLIDYGEVEDAHLYKDPAKLEACCWFIYTTLPIPARALQRARRGPDRRPRAREIRWWLTLPAAVAEVLAERAKQYSNPLTHETLPELLRAACAASGHAGKRVDVDEVMLRFAPEAECEEYLREAEIMISLLMPSADLNLAGQTAMSKGRFDCPPFITKERLRMCWEQVTQIRGLLPQASSLAEARTHTHSLAWLRSCQSFVGPLSSFNNISMRPRSSTSPTRWRRSIGSPTLTRAA